MARPQKVATAARSGDKRKTLIALRNNLAVQIDDCKSGRDAAALSKRLIEVINELETLPEPNVKYQNPVQKARAKAEARNGPS